MKVELSNNNFKRNLILINNFLKKKNSNGINYISNLEKMFKINHKCKIKTQKNN